ncbi:hypothetical protein GCM10007382_20880 [Salinibacterium xinjiangense]|nr:hypothetical protein GCM10007382_20880 [Salinibacterium xinjiangense]
MIRALPLITLTEIGIIVGIGTLLDSPPVRTVSVPTLAVIADAGFWWPSRPARWHTHRLVGSSTEGSIPPR